MRVMAIVALALLLAGCTGDRMNQGSNTRQPQSLWPFHTHDAL
jgi:PBP1b-binding outer membrane lipoprotein LpoB